MKTLNEIKTELEKKLPPALVGRLFEHYTEIKNNYFLGKYEPSELNAGKFVEVAYRIIESQLNADGSYTPLGTRVADIVGKLRGIENEPKSALTEPLRRHIPRVLISITEIRNNRGVGHTPGTINPNYLDSTFLVTACDWVVGDLVREFCGFSAEEAQNTVDSIIERKIPIVFELGDLRRVLVKATYREKIMLLLCDHEREWVPEAELFSWSKHSNITNFRALPRQCDKEGLIEYDRRNRWVLILPPGMKLAEEKIAKHE